MSDQSPSTIPGTSNGACYTRERGQPGPYDRADSPEGVSDDLAALFLGGADPDDEPAPTTQVELKPAGGRGRPTLSLLVLGNLPVHAPGWASQYARDRHNASGRPQGLLTLGDESARLEVFGAAGSQVSADADLGRALERLSRLDADLIVRLPEAEAGWIGGACHAATMTILTGADDPAIVGAYQSIKSISQDLPPESTGPAMRVAVAGSAETVARDAASKLAQAAQRFLGLHVDGEPPVLRIDAGVSAELYHGEPPAWADVPDLLAGVLERGDGPDVQTRPDAGDQFEPRRSSVPAGFNAEGGEIPISKAKPAPQPQVDTRTTQAPPASTQGGKPAPPASRSSPAGGVARPAPEGHASRPLPEGLEPVEVTCPYASDVALAVDGSGVLHAVAWASDSERASAAVRDLVVASSWLRDHGDLVAVIIGRPLLGLPSVRHLVLRDARGALGLAHGELRLHVAAPHAPVLVDLN